MRWLPSKLRPTTPRKNSATTAATTPPATSPETSRGGDVSFTAVAPGSSLHRRTDSQEPPPARRGLLQLFACTGKRPNSPPDRSQVGPETLVTKIATPRATWAQQREVEAVLPFGCLRGAGATLKKAVTAHDKATARVADRHRQRRRGSRQRRSTEAVDMSDDTPNSATSMLRSQSCPPLAMMDDGLVVEARDYGIIPETPSQASPLESDVPRPALFSVGRCPPEEDAASSNGLTLRAQAFNRHHCIVDQFAYRPGSAPPAFRSPNPEAVPSPCKLSPGFSILSPIEQKDGMLSKGMLSPADSTSPSSIPPLPAMPLCVASVEKVAAPALPPNGFLRRVSSPHDRVPKRMASPLGVPKRTSRTSSPAFPGTIKRDQSPADFLKAMVSQQQQPDEHNATARVRPALTKQDASTSPRAMDSTSPTDTDCSAGSPNILQRLQKQGLWPPPDVCNSEAWAWPAAAEKNTLNAPKGETPKASEDKRSKEAQQLLANMLTGRAPTEARRRHGSAPPLGSRVHDAADILSIPSPSSTTNPVCSIPTCSSKVGIHGSGSGKASRREATAPPLRPINGSIPDFPPAEKIK